MVLGGGSLTPRGSAALPRHQDSVGLVKAVDQSVLSLSSVCLKGYTILYGTVDARNHGSGLLNSKVSICLRHLTEQCSRAMPFLVRF